MPQDFGINGAFFYKNAYPIGIKNYISNRKTQIYKSNSLEGNAIKLETKPNVTIEKSGNLEILDRVQFYVAFRDIVSQRPIHRRISPKLINSILNFELHKAEIKHLTSLLFYNNGLATKIKSEEFRYDKCTTYGMPILMDADGNTKYQLLVRFPNKTNYVFLN